MATGESAGDTLETWLNKATDPGNPDDRWDCIQAFYEQVNREADGPQVATRLLAHKIQSPQEKEALQALTLLEACMNNCGKTFHTEAGKFRFLNELIKVLSPKYLGMWSTGPVKQRVTEVLYSWTQWLKDEPKIQEAYRMLKKQGVVKKDPKLPDTIVMPPPSQRLEGSVFDDEDKSKLLDRLLKSNRPEDLQSANRLIKSTIKEEQDKAERVRRRISTLEEVETKTTQLRELLNQHHRSGQHTQEMKLLYERCDRLRPNLFRLASDTVDEDEALAEILQANDKLTSAVNLYRETAGRREANSSGAPEPSSNHVPTSPVRSYHLIDLSALDAPPPSAVSPPRIAPDNPTSLLLLLDEEFSSPGVHSATLTQTQQNTKSHFDELIQLEDRTRVQTAAVAWEKEETLPGHTLTTRGCGEDFNSHNSFPSPALEVLQSRSALSDRQNQPIVTSRSPSKSDLLSQDKSLADVFVSLESIKPSRIEPVTVFDRCGVHLSLHFCTDSPASRPDIAVIVVSMVNTSALPVSDFLFQAAAPKTMMVKLQPATGKVLPSYNPILPPAAISQILLLSNPLGRPVRLRYKLMLTQGAEQISNMGEIDHFPEWASWTQV